MWLSWYILLSNFMLRLLFRCFSFACDYIHTMMCKLESWTWDREGWLTGAVVENYGRWINLYRHPWFMLIGIWLINMAKARSYPTFLYVRFHILDGTCHSIVRACWSYQYFYPIERPKVIYYISAWLHKIRKKKESLLIMRPINLIHDDNLNPYPKQTNN